MVASKIKSKEKKRLDFPKLMISGKTGLIVLFEQEMCGSVVFKDIYNEVGEYSTAWPMFEFSDFKGELTLKNEDNEQF